MSRNCVLLVFLYSRTVQDKLDLAIYTYSVTLVNSTAGDVPYHKLIICGCYSNHVYGSKHKIKHMKHLLGGKRETTPAIYNPHYGYEPYWENGDWVFHEEELPPDVTTTSVPLVCGEECLEMYTTIGEVCGRYTKNVEYQGCRPTLISWFCSGSILDEQSQGYTTFPSYCKFLDRQCRAGLDNRWILVHRGACVVPQSEVFKPFSLSGQAIDRMKFYLTSLASLFDNYTIDHTILDKKK